MAMGIFQIIFATPRQSPRPTPMATQFIGRDFLKLPAVKVSAVLPKALSAGSTRVAPNPIRKANEDDNSSDTITAAAKYRA